MSRRYLIVLLLLVLLISACQSASLTPTAVLALPTSTLVSTIIPTSVPTLVGAQVVVQVDVGRQLQSLQTVSGGNFIHHFAQTGAPLEPVSSYNLDHLSMKHARVRICLEEWELQNDDDDSTHFDWHTFEDTGDNHNTFLFMQELQKRSIAIIATIWDIPAWMTPDSSVKTNKFIPYETYPEVVESLAAWLMHAREQYGVKVDYISFNEPNIGVNVSLSAREAIKIIQAAGARFDELGLTTRWLLGDTSNFNGSVSYAQTVWSEVSIRRYLGPLAVHSWDADAPDSVLERIAEFAVREGVEVWCTEAGWDPFLYTRPEEYTTWNNAIQLAVVYSRMLKLSRVSVILYWEMMANDYALSDGTQPYLAFDVLYQLGKYLPPGSQVVWTSPDANGVYFFAVVAGDQFVFYLVNTNATSIAVQAGGLPAGKYQHIQSTSQETGKTVETIDAGPEPFLIPLHASSINLLVLQTNP
jgi:O-glycosyl hydrolase